MNTLDNMEEDKISIEPEEFWCLNYSTKDQCKNCDGFGRMSALQINTKNCYNSLNQMKESLDLNKKVNLD